VIFIKCFLKKFDKILLHFSIKYDIVFTWFATFNYPLEDLTLVQFSFRHWPTAVDVDQGI